MLSWARISLPKRFIITSMTACLQASESLHTITKYFWKVSSFLSTKSMSMSPNTFSLFTFSDKNFVWILSSPTMLYVPPITPNLITLIIFYRHKTYESSHVNFHVLRSIYPSAVQMISSVFSSQTPATNMHWFKPDSDGKKNGRTVLRQQ